MESCILWETYISWASQESHLTPPPQKNKFMGPKSIVPYSKQRGTGSHTEANKFIPRSYFLSPTWRFWFVPSVPGYLREEEEHKPDPWRNPITADMLQTVWNELDYRVDVCRITNGAHIEHL